MDSGEEKSSDVSTGIGTEEGNNVFSEDFMFYPMLAKSICSEIKVQSNSLELLEMQLLQNNQDQFIDLSYQS